MSNETIDSGQLPGEVPPLLPTSAPAGYGAIALMAGGSFIYAFMESMVPAAIPTMQVELGASPSEMAWVLTGLLVVGAVALPLTGRLSDLVDKKRVLVGLLIVAAIGAVVAATAPNAQVLAVGQMLQGIAIAMGPVCVGIMRDTMPPERLRHGNAILIGVSAVAAGLGLLVVGWLLRHFDYTAIYWAPAVALILTAIMIGRLIPACPPRVRGRIDWAGAATLALCVGALTLGISLSAEHGWDSLVVLGLLAAAVVLLAAFVAMEMRIRVPLLDLRGLGVRELRFALAIAFLAGASTYFFLLVVPQLAVLPEVTGYGMGVAPSSVGLVLLPYAVTAAIGAPFASRMHTVLGARWLLGIASVSIALAGVLLLWVGSVPWITYVSGGLIGFGLGIGMTALLNLVVDFTAPERVASVASVIFVIRNVGGLLAGQVGAAIIAKNMDLDLLPGLPVPSWTGLVICLALCIGTGLLAAVCSGALGGRTSAAVRT